MKKLNFKEYLSLSQGYLDQTADLLGIRQKDADKARKLVPGVVANATFDYTANLTPYKIIDLGRNDQGHVVSAKIQVMNDDEMATRGRQLYKKSGEEYIRMKNGTDMSTKIYVVKVDPKKLKDPTNATIDDIMSQGMNNQPQGGAGSNPLGMM